MPALRFERGGNASAALEAALAADPTTRTATGAAAQAGDRQAQRAVRMLLLADAVQSGAVGVLGACAPVLGAVFDPSSIAQEAARRAAAEAAAAAAAAARERAAAQRQATAEAEARAAAHAAAARARAGAPQLPPQQVPKWDPDQRVHVVKVGTKGIEKKDRVVYEAPFGRGRRWAITRDGIVYQGRFKIMDEARARKLGL
jgi:hypothetical protein